MINTTGGFLIPIGVNKVPLSDPPVMTNSASCCRNIVFCVGAIGLVVVADEPVCPVMTCGTAICNEASMYSVRQPVDHLFFILAK
jgi:hypothetical protein